MNHELSVTDDEALLVAVLILLAWEAGKLSEGQVCRALKIDRLTAREQRDEMVKRGVAAFQTIRQAQGQPS